MPGPPDWLDVVVDLDAARGRALAEADPALLADVYVAGVAGRRGGRADHRPAGRSGLAGGRRAAPDRQRDAGRPGRRTRRPADRSVGDRGRPAHPSGRGRGRSAGRQSPLGAPSSGGCWCSARPTTAIGSAGSNRAEPPLIPRRRSPAVAAPGSGAARSHWAGPFGVSIPVTVGPHSYRDPMRLMHTSDWHLGRTFHGQSLLADQESVLGALADLAVAHAVDVVLISGDLYDRAVPSPEAVQCATRILGRIRAAGISIVAISGNHDSAPRLGAFADFLAAGGLHLRTAAARAGEPVLLADAHGPVALYPVPYLEPDLVRGTLGAARPGQPSAGADQGADAGPRRPRRPTAGHPVGGAGARLRGRRDRRRIRTIDRRRGSGVGLRRRLRRVRLRRARPPARRAGRHRTDPVLRIAAALCLLRGRAAEKCPARRPRRAPAPSAPSRSTCR